eukprot:TRINITY_DN47215_c0_g1_i1.p1 TRINITY_DN47215_c0_g1~~TRINITY_DN47215_c0_g1_i1.p1  ORF type:complete len:244 (+),score=25.23 TRINITY_DN47215_c0_g1_i1:38-733(+)
MAAIWMLTYLIMSISIDVIRVTLIVIGAMQMEGWSYFVAAIVKFMVLAILMGVHCASDARAWVSMGALTLGFVLPVYVHLPWPDLRALGIEAQEVSYLLFNRCLEALVMIAYVLAKEVPDRDEDGNQQQPERFSSKMTLKSCSDLTDFVQQTCTWIQIWDPEDGRVSDATTCCICLDSLASDELVTQLVCKHVFHADCVSAWLSLQQFRRLSSLMCPMRCPPAMLQRAIFV